MVVLRACGLQIESTIGDKQANLNHASDMIAKIEASHGHMDLYVLPELFVTGYGAFDRLEELAEDSGESESIHFLGQVAKQHQCHICFGLPRKGESGFFFISQAVVDQTGNLIHVYDKLHCCGHGDCAETKMGFTSGSKIGFFSIGDVRVGITICYDIRFPELFRTLAWDAGCDLILHPAAFIRDTTFPSYHPFVITRAGENQCYMLSVSYAGSSFGASIMAPPWFGPVPMEDGTERNLSPQFLETEEGPLVCEVDSEVLQAVRRAFPYKSDLNKAVKG